ncbi:hypothetical protein [Streptomyces sp. NBC_00841]|uniref:hypothetical protein n=1 Tax=Streptomyces sp. NBC_00841 TaxID=2975847 RepID=UPI003FA390E6
MIKTLNTTFNRAARREPPLITGTWWDRSGEWWLATVAGAFTLAQLVMVRPGIGLGWDESVYVSQVSSHAPTAFFSAPRARGVSLLVAPIASWTSSTPLLRVYLSLLSGLALFLALRAWRGLSPVRVLALAGALFASLWVTVLYGPQAMPNYWVATGALAGVGCFLRAQSDRTRHGAVCGLAASAALMAWMRPADAVWMSLPLLVALVVVRRWRYWRLLFALVAGLVAGAGEWVIETHLSYGGLGARLTKGSRIQGGLGFNNAVDDQLRSLAGRTLCRPCTGTMPAEPLLAWWFALPVFAVVGLVVAMKARRTAATLLPLACAVTAALPYLFLIGYAAPRFLQPAYALLAIPVADTLGWLVTAPRRRWRPLAVTLVAVGLTRHLAVQYAVLQHTVERTTAAHQGWARVTGELHRLGIRPPCLLTRHEAVPIAFYAGRSSVATSGPNANTTKAVITRTAQREPVAVLTTRTGRPPSYARSWHPYRMDNGTFAYVAPAAPESGRR